MRRIRDLPSFMSAGLPEIVTKATYLLRLSLVIIPSQVVGGETIPFAVRFSRIVSHNDEDTSFFPVPPFSGVCFATRVLAFCTKIWANIFLCRGDSIFTFFCKFKTFLTYISLLYIYIYSFVFFYVYIYMRNIYHIQV